MPTAEKVIKEIYLLPMKEREKVVRHIIEFGIKISHHDIPEILDINEWQDKIASKPFNLKQASEYVGVSSVTLRRWIKTGKVSAYKIGRAYTFEVVDLKRFKKSYLTKKFIKLKFRKLPEAP
ncbi:helix-turn-helix domain-containing protein [Desulfobacula sp.]